ncbi:hypothetical protein POX_c04613 [Penicillium oxalicum]|uniref:hypothetical protein n=1 Tax=Penicillium oxalicum TaxID=69781 RepID=UPI0020B8E47A|nr:hypothetical protein POX_c04613 [Penicillium oxalicum]KAI2791736.1 hypothetical protein POX_c04613 [Penicillium oxalicum]
MSDVVLTGSTGSTRASSIVVDEDDEKNPEEDNSDADTVRMSTPDYERWTSENRHIKSRNLLLTESTPASTFLKYRNCQRLEHTQTSQASPPATRGEPNKVGDSKKGT